MGQRPWRRKNYLIRKDFQGRFILRSFLAILVGAAVFTVILSIFSAHTMTVTYEDSALRIDRTPKALFLYMVRAYGVYILLLGVLISVVAVFLSHRIAGPLFRFERSVEEITRGNLAFCVILRKKDEGKELAGLMNEMITSLASRIRSAKEEAEAAYSGLEGLSRRLAEGQLSPGEAGEQIAGAMNSLRNLKTTLSFFSTDKG
jgi:nitrogen fixation/metabolism regulation signal transduction histidine kinase